MSRGSLCEMSGREPEEGNPFELLRAEFRDETIVRNQRLRNFSGGAVGYFGYDMVRHIERLLETVLSKDRYSSTAKYINLKRMG